MRKRVFPRIIFITLLYCAVFLFLVSVQFSKRGAFTRNIAGFVVSGHYRENGENNGADNLANDAGKFLIEGDVYVIFGGMEYALVNRRDGNSLRLTGPNWSREALPEAMVVSEDSINFILPGGTALIFTNQQSGNAVDMRITGVFSEDVTGIELPFRLQRRTSIQSSGDGQFIVSADGVKYTFGSSPIDADRRVLLINAGGELVSYKTLPELDVFSPDDFVLREAEAAEAYNVAITRWIDQNFSLWSRSISGLDNEDIVVALVGEAINRGSYRAAVNAVSTAFRNGSNRTYESSVFLGNLDTAYRDLIAADNAKLDRLTRSINERSLEFLLEPRVFEFLGVRGYQNLMDAAADLVDTIDPAILSPDLVPGILEGYTDWEAYGDSANGINAISMDNPFRRLVDPAFSVISGFLTRTDFPTGNARSISGGDQGAIEGRVFLLYNDTEDPEFNLRLGKALLACAEAVRNNSWAGVGRSMILSALYGTGEDFDPSHSELAHARLYRILCPRDSYPRAVAIAPQPANTWAWTASPALSVSREGDTLDIDVSFLAGETHFMIIRGIPTFSRIQLYNIDFRTDPQFERYDSSGWSYSSQDQTLIVKMLQRSQVERIRIIF
jgi:hypothetical protein